MARQEEVVEAADHRQLPWPWRQTQRRLPGLRQLRRREVLLVDDDELDEEHEEQANQQQRAVHSWPANECAGACGEMVMYYYCRAASSPVKEVAHPNSTQLEPFFVTESTLETTSYYKPIAKCSCFSLKFGWMDPSGFRHGALSPCPIYLFLCHRSIFFFRT